MSRGSSAWKSFRAAPQNRGRRRRCRCAPSAQPRQPYQANSRHRSVAGEPGKPVRRIQKEDKSLYETPVPGTTLTRNRGSDLLRLYSRSTALKLPKYELILLHYDPVLISENPKRASDQGKRRVVPFELVLLSRQGLLPLDN